MQISYIDGGIQRYVKSSPLPSLRCEEARTLDCSFQLRDGAYRRDYSVFHILSGFLTKPVMNMKRKVIETAYFRSKHIRLSPTPTSLLSVCLMISTTW